MAKLYDSISSSNAFMVTGLCIPGTSNRYLLPSSKVLSEVGKLYKSPSGNPNFFKNSLLFSMSFFKMFSYFYQMYDKKKMTCLHSNSSLHQSWFQPNASVFRHILLMR